MEHNSPSECSDNIDRVRESPDQSLDEENPDQVREDAEQMQARIWRILSVMSHKQLS